MTNSELKELLNSIKPTQNELNEMKNASDSISNIIKNNIDGGVKVAELRVGGSFAKGTIIKGRKEIDMVVVISPKNNKKLYYKDLANLSMNSIENSLYLNYYEKLNEVECGEKIIRNYDRNTLSLINANKVDIDFLVKFKKEQLMGKANGDVENFYLERDDKQLTFINYANNDYSLFKNTVMLIKHFRNQENLHQLKSYTIEVMLYYALVKYLDGKTYTSYLNAFFKGLKDFIDKKIIEVDDKMYSRLGVKKTNVPNDRYRVLDVANRSNNVAKYIKDSDISSFESFYNKFKNSFKDDNAQTLRASAKEKTLNCKINYEWVVENTDVRIVSEIPSMPKYETDIIKNNTNTTFDNVIDDFYSHLLRIVKLTNKHNLGNNIIIECRTQLINIYENYVIKGDNNSIQGLSTEQKNKYSQLKQRIKKDGIKITFKSL